MVLACIALGIPAFAQNQENKPNPPENKAPGGPTWADYANNILTPEEIKQLQTDNDKASKNPDVAAALKAQSVAITAALLDIDPALAPVVEKLEAARLMRKMGNTNVATLTPEEKASYNKAMLLALKTPAVQAAVKAYSDLKKSVVLKDDPGAARLMEKSEACRKAYEEAVKANTRAKNQALAESRKEQSKKDQKAAPAPGPAL